MRGLQVRGERGLRDPPLRVFRGRRTRKGSRASDTGDAVRLWICETAHGSTHYQGCAQCSIRKNLPERIHQKATTDNYQYIQKSRCKGASGFSTTGTVARHNDHGRRAGLPEQPGAAWQCPGTAGRQEEDGRRKAPDSVFLQAMQAYRKQPWKDKEHGNGCTRQVGNIRRVQQTGRSHREIHI